MRYRVKLNKKYSFYILIVLLISSLFFCKTFKNKCQDNLLAQEFLNQQKQENKTSEKQTEFVPHRPESNIKINVQGLIEKDLFDLHKQNKLFPLLQKLVENLDADSIETVNKVVYRSIQFCNKEEIDPPTPKEANELIKLEREFRITKIANDTFAYKDYLLPINHFECCSFIYKKGISNIRNLESIKNKETIDAGGFVGDTAIVFSRYTNKFVHSFEPSSYHFNLFKKTIKLNNKSNIIPIKKALGSKKETVLIPIINDANSGFRTNQTSTTKDSVKTNKNELCDIITLDEYVQKNKLNVGLIHLDVEGVEQDVLKGAQETIRKQKPALIISIYHSTSDFFNIKPTLESLNSGYKFQIFKFCPSSISAETVLIAQVD